MHWFEYNLALKRTLTLKLGLEVIQGHWKRRHSIVHTCIWLPIYVHCSIVTMALSCTILTYLNLKNTATLKSGLRSLEVIETLVPFDGLPTVPSSNFVSKMHRLW